MLILGYFRSAPGKDGRALIQEYCASLGLEPALILCDEEGEYSAFRRLQSLVKLKKADAVIMPDEISLGAEAVMRIENRLFFERNGVRLILIKRERTDHRHDIALCIKRFYSLIAEHDCDYGLTMPLSSERSRMRRTPPFGYRVVDGKAMIDGEDSDKVRRIFREYSSGRRIGEICSDIDALSTRGKRFGNMTVKTVLKNDRYIGRPSRKGYQLSSIVEYDSWLKARERFENEYGSEKSLRPFCVDIRADSRIAYFRSSDPVGFNNARKLYPGFLLVDSDRVEKAVEELIASVTGEKNADAFFEDYLLVQRRKAESALLSAKSEYNETLARFNRALSQLIAGDASDELQRELDTLTDRKNVYAMRLRRAGSELELYSASREQVREVFSRAARLGTLSSEEKSFLSAAFVPSVRIRSGVLTAKLVSPCDGSLKKYRINNALYPDND